METMENLIIIMSSLLIGMSIIFVLLIKKISSYQNDIIEYYTREISAIKDFVKDAQKTMTHLVDQVKKNTQTVDSLDNTFTGTAFMLTEMARTVHQIKKIIDPEPEKPKVKIRRKPTERPQS